MTPEEKKLYIANGHLAWLMTLWDKYLEESKEGRMHVWHDLDTDKLQESEFKGDFHSFMEWLLAH